MYKLIPKAISTTGKWVLMSDQLSSEDSPALSNKTPTEMSGHTYHLSILPPITYRRQMTSVTVLGTGKQVLRQAVQNRQFSYMYLCVIYITQL